MVRAYVLVECDKTDVVVTVNALRCLDGVLQADAALGPYDMVILAEKPNVEAMANFVIKEIQKVHGVQRTTTCLSAKLG